VAAPFLQRAPNDCGDASNPNGATSIPPCA
jgi:hypothetical protein